MNIRTPGIISIVFFTLTLAACGQQEQAEPGQPQSDQVAAPAEEAPAADAAADDAVVDHMHSHAEKLDDLMFALADGDLERARTPAYWLSQHEVLEGIPEEWQDYAIGMHNAAYEVEIAEDLEAARAAAEDISAHCQGCHAAAGLSGSG